MADRKKELATEAPGKLLFKYSMPAMVALVVNSIYNLVDTIFIGHGAGTLALAGLTIAFPVQIFIMAIGHLVAIGAASMVSRNLGANNQEKANATAGTAIGLIGIISIPLTIATLVFIKPFLRFFGATNKALPYAADYMSIVILGAVFFSTAICMNALARSEGNIKVAMKTMILGAALNIVLDPIFIFGFKMGIKGAALATLIGQTSSFLYLVYYFKRGDSLLKFRRRDLVPKLRLLPEMISIGFASFARLGLASVLAVVANNLIAHYGSELHLAIFGVSHRAVNFAGLPVLGILQGMQPIIGFNYGAKQIDRVKQALKLGILSAMVFSTFAYFMLSVFTRQILNIFSSDELLINEGIPIVRTVVLMFAFVGFQMIGSSLFQTIGKPGPALLLSVARHGLFLTPILLFLPSKLGLSGIWISFPLADFLSISLTLIMVIREVKNFGRMQPSKIKEPLPVIV